MNRRKAALLLAMAALLVVPIAGGVAHAVPCSLTLGAVPSLVGGTTATQSITWTSAGDCLVGAQVTVSAAGRDVVSGKALSDPGIGDPNHPWSAPAPIPIGGSPTSWNTALRARADDGTTDPNNAPSWPDGSYTLRIELVGDPTVFDDQSGIVIDNSGPTGEIIYSGNTLYPYPVIVRPADGTTLTGTGTDPNTVSSIGPSMLFEDILGVKPDETVPVTCTGCPGGSITFSANISSVSSGLWAMSVPMTDSLGNVGYAVISMVIV